MLGIGFSAHQCIHSILDLLFILREGFPNLLKKDWTPPAYAGFACNAANLASRVAGMVPCNNRPI